MGSCNKHIISPTITVYSKGDTINGLFHATTGAIPSEEVHNVRASRLVTENSGGADIQAAIRYGNDGENWDSATAFGPASSSTEGWTYGTSFVDVTTGHGTRKLYAQLGAIVKNASGAEVECCRVRARFDFE